jgi:acyl-CoA dehydrogenase
MRFVIHSLAELSRLSGLDGFEEATEDTVDAILDEAAKFAGGVLSPLNRVGDRIGAAFDQGRVTTPPGWQDAYRQFNEGGWGALGIDPAHGGMGLPRVVSAAVSEMWNSANLAFALCPMLTSGAIEALLLRGSDALKARYIPPLVSGAWTGTMNLTEPQAGSDLAAIRTRAEKQSDGSYRITGQKIYITYGEHDLTENIIHMVLARTPDAPPGVKGISLFLVPKRLVNDDGSLGPQNDVRALSIEHKLGIHASPTCVMAYGESGGATGYLVGEENRGLEIMFIMMNAARFAVGMEGLALAERAYQAARDYARERVQGASVSGARGAIIEHPRRAAHVDADEIANRSDARALLCGGGSDGHGRAPR